MHGIPRTPLTALIALILTGCGSGRPEVTPTPSEPEQPVSSRPCARWAAPEAHGRVESADLTEISGLAVSRKNPGILWVHQDSGTDPELWALNREGAAVTRVRLRKSPAVDWEDIALGPCPAGLMEEHCLWVGDIGDNSRVRDDTALLVTAEPDLTGAPATMTLDALRWSFRYPDGPRDAEALVVPADGRPVIYSKESDGSTRPFRFPALASGVDDGLVVEALPVIELGKGGLGTMVTGADLWPDGSRLVLRSYGHLFELNVPGGAIERVTGTGAVDIPPPVEIQGEAVAYDPLLRGLRTVSEGVNPTLWMLPCALP